MQRCRGFGYLNIQNQKKFRVGPNRVPKNIKIIPIPSLEMSHVPSSEMSTVPWHWKNTRSHSTFP